MPDNLIYKSNPESEICKNASAKDFEYGLLFTVWSNELHKVEHFQNPFNINLNFKILKCIYP